MILGTLYHAPIGTFYLEHVFDSLVVFCNYGHHFPGMGFN